MLITEKFDGFLLYFCNGGVQLIFCFRVCPAPDRINWCVSVPLWDWSPTRRSWKDVIPSTETWVTLEGFKNPPRAWATPSIFMGLSEFRNTGFKFAKHRIKLLLWGLRNLGALKASLVSVFVGIVVRLQDDVGQLCSLVKEVVCGVVWTGFLLPR